MKNIIAISLVSLLAACGGAGHGSSSAIPAASTSSGMISFPVTIPASIPVLTKSQAESARTSAREVKPAFVSPNTQSMAITLGFESAQSSFQAAAPVSVQSLAPNAPNCVASQGGGRTCTVQVPLSAQIVSALETAANTGGDLARLELFASTDGSGQRLSSSLTPFTLFYNGTGVTTVPVTLDPVLDHFTMTPSAPSGPCISDALAVAPCVVTLTVTPYDPSGAVIIGPGTFITPAGSNAFMGDQSAINIDGATSIGSSVVGISGPGWSVFYSPSDVVPVQVAWEPNYEWSSQSDLTKNIVQSFAGFNGEPNPPWVSSIPETAIPAPISVAVVSGGPAGTLTGNGNAYAYGYVTYSTAQSSFSISDGRYLGSVSESDTCASMATVSLTMPAYTTPGTLSVIPKASGTCTVSITDGVQTTKLAVTVP